jgi:hypothetical protein
MCRWHVHPHQHFGTRSSGSFSPTPERNSSHARMVLSLPDETTDVGDGFSRCGVWSRVNGSLRSRMLARAATRRGRAGGCRRTQLRHHQRQHLDRRSRTAMGGGAGCKRRSDRARWLDCGHPQGCGGAAARRCRRTLVASRFHRLARALHRWRLPSRIGAAARCEDARGVCRSNQGVRRHAAAGQLDHRRGLGSLALGRRAAGTRLDRRGHAGQSGVGGASGRTHGARQHGGAEGGRHREVNSRRRWRHDRAGRQWRADGRAEGQCDVARRQGCSAVVRTDGGSRTRGRDEIRCGARRYVDSQHGHLESVGHVCPGASSRHALKRESTQPFHSRTGSGFATS